MNELFPSAILFGMSSKEFWEGDPQLYWSYRIFYEKKIQMETEKIDYVSWSMGMYNFNAFSVVLNNALSKKKVEYPNKPVMFKKEIPKTKLQKELEQEKDKNVRNQKEFNYWARM